MDLWVMSPTRYRCATQLYVVLRRIELLTIRYRQYVWKNSIRRMLYQLSYRTTKPILSALWFRCKQNNFVCEIVLER